MLSALQLLGEAQQRAQVCSSWAKSVLTSPLTPLTSESGPNQSRSQQGGHLKGGQSWFMMCDQALTLWLWPKNHMLVLAGLHPPPCWGSMLGLNLCSQHGSVQGLSLFSHQALVLLRWNLSGLGKFLSPCNLPQRHSPWPDMAACTWGGDLEAPQFFAWCCNNKQSQTIAEYLWWVHKSHHFPPSQQNNSRWDQLNTWSSDSPSLLHAYGNASRQAKGSSHSLSLRVVTELPAYGLSSRGKTGGML